MSFADIIPAGFSAKTLDIMIRSLQQQYPAENGDWSDRETAIEKLNELTNYELLLLMSICLD